MTSKRTVSRSLALMAGLAIAVGACTSGGGATSSGSTATIPGVQQALIDAAKGEGNLTTIALPHSWCDYGDLLKNFTAKFGIKINELNPDGG
jgi:putative spermidine/putrescine transport system substrate-binding protein